MRSRRILRSRSNIDVTTRGWLSGNARSEQLHVMPTELLTKREWLPGELVSGLERQRPGCFFWIWSIRRDYWVTNIQRPHFVILQQKVTPHQHVEQSRSTPFSVCWYNQMNQQKLHTQAQMEVYIKKEERNEQANVTGEVRLSGQRRVTGNKVECEGVKESRCDTPPTASWYPPFNWIKLAWLHIPP